MKSLVRACLIDLALALILVGVVSGTLIRHVVQIRPIVFVLVVLQSRPAWGAYAAVPIFVFWIGIVILIWLFLLGLSRVASGQYTSAEIFLTFVMAACSLAGLLRSISLGRSLPVRARAGMVLLFGGLQVAAMWISFLKAFAND
jgi:hypothetical protein